MKKFIATMELHVQWFVRTWRLLSNWPLLFLQKFRVPAFQTDTTLKMRSGPTYIADKRGWGVDDLTAVWIDKVYGDPSTLNSTLPVIIDIGAHIGTYAVYAALRSPQARVLALEPNPAVFTYLEKSIAANNLGSQVTPIMKAVAQSAEKRLLFLDEGGGVSSSLFKRHGRALSEGISVPCMTLADLYAEYNISHCDVLKLNCEGAEYEILGGLSDEMFNSIDSILLQWHRIEDHEPAELDQLLAKKGYTVTRAPAPYKFIYAHRSGLKQ